MKIYRKLSNITVASTLVFGSIFLNGCKEKKEVVESFGDAHAPTSEATPTATPTPSSHHSYSYSPAVWLLYMTLLNNSQRSYSPYSHFATPRAYPLRPVPNYSLTPSVDKKFYPSQNRSQSSFSGTQNPVAKPVIRGGFGTSLKGSASS